MADARLKVLPVLRKLGGQATVGEVVEGTGLTAPDVTATLWTLVNELQGNVEVGKGGDVLFKFPPGLKKPTEHELWAQFWSGVYRGFKQLFKIGIMLMLLVYFVVFAVLAVCMVIATIAKAAGDSDSSSDGWSSNSSSHSSSSFDLGNLLGWLWVTDTSPSYQPYDRWQRNRGMSPRVVAPSTPKLPLFERVVAYVFGDDVPGPDPSLPDREALAYVREHAGVLTATDVVALQATPMKEAAGVASRLAFRNGGFVELTDSAQLLFRFDDIMSRVAGRQTASGWSYAWERPEDPVKLNSNGPAFNAVVTCVNGFNLLWSGWLVTPGGLETLSDTLGSDFSGAGLVLGGIPFVFSLTFFAIPALRWFANGVKNERIANRNRWRELVGKLMQKHVMVARPTPATPALLGCTPDELRRLEEAYGASEAGSGLVFDRLRAEWKAATAARRGDNQAKWRFGGVVFSTEDAPNIEAPASRAREMA